MSEPLLNQSNLRKPTKPVTTRLGYNISQSQDAVQEALNKGFALVNNVKKASADVRVWAAQTLKETNKLVKKMKKEHKGQESKPGGILKPDQQLWEITYWENEISRVIRVYFSDVSGIMEELKKLNPPLTSKQLEPFISVMLRDRRATFTSFEPLTKIVGELAKLKSIACVNNSPHFLKRNIQS